MGAVLCSVDGVRLVGKGLGRMERREGEIRKGETGRVFVPRLMLMAVE